MSYRVPADRDDQSLERAGSSPDATAVLAAHVRSKSIDDPAARSLVAAAGGVDESRFPRELVDHVVESVRVRTSFLDDVVMRSVRRGTSQIVILGSGLDTRPWRLPVPNHVHTYLVDRDGTAGFSSEVLGNSPYGQIRSVTVDVTQLHWSAKLVESGLNPDRRVLYIAEALLVYLSASEARNVAYESAGLGSPGSEFAFTYGKAQRNPDSLYSSLRKSVSEVGGEFKSAISQPQSYIDGTGWTLSEVETYDTYRSKLPDIGDNPSAWTQGREPSWLCLSAHQ